MIHLREDREHHRRGDCRERRADSRCRISTRFHAGNDALHGRATGVIPWRADGGHRSRAQPHLPALRSVSATGSAKRGRVARTLADGPDYELVNSTNRGERRWRCSVSASCFYCDFRRHLPQFKTGHRFLPWSPDRAVLYFSPHIGISRRAGRSLFIVGLVLLALELFVIPGFITGSWASSYLVPYFAAVDLRTLCSMVPSMFKPISGLGQVVIAFSSLFLGIWMSETLSQGFHKIALVSP